MAYSTEYVDLIGRRHVVTRYEEGERLTFRDSLGELIPVVVTGPGEAMVPNFTPVRVEPGYVCRHAHIQEFVASNDYLTPRD